MKTILKFAAIILAGFISFTSCKKDLVVSPPSSNKPPVANAGTDQKIVLPKDSILLDGSSSFDPNGKIVSYKWIKISGPVSSNIINTDSTKTLVKTLVIGIYKFELTVTDNGGLSAKDTVQIIVDDPKINQPPIANAGPDQTITLPTTTVNLDGRSSADPDNNITSYAWTNISGPLSSTIANANSVQTQVMNLVQGTYKFELKVTDAGGLFSKDTMQVIVNNTIQTTCPFQQTLIGTLPVYRYGMQTAAAGNKIVFAAGWEVLSVPSSGVNIFDVVTQTWSNATLSNQGGYVAVISAGDKIFFAGGTTPTGAFSSRVDIYNTTNNSWTTTELSEARSAVRAAKAGNKVLFAGGSNASGQWQSARVDVYDLSSLSWSSTHNLSQISSSEAVSVGDKAVFGVGTNGVEIYDASSNSWSTHTFSQPQFGYSTATSGNKIYLAGGNVAVNAVYTFTDVVNVYDIISNTWTSTTMSHPKAGMSSIGADGKIFWAGGFDSSWSDANDDYVRNVNDIEIYDINTGTHSHHFFANNTITPKVGVANNQVMFTEGNPIHIYNSNSGTWTVCDINLGWVGGWAPACISRGKKIYVVAGGYVNGFLSNQVWKLEF